MNELTKKESKFIRMAYDLAYDHEGAFRAKICAILVHKNHIAFGFNMEKSDPYCMEFQKHKDSIFIHAEINAIKNAIFHKNFDENMLSRSTMYVARSKKNGDWGLAKPCCSNTGKGCFAAIKSFNIPKVIYTTNEYEKVGIIRY